MTYLFVPFPMTLDNLEGHSPNAGLIKCNSTNIYATFSTVLTVTVRRAVPRRQLSFLFDGLEMPLLAVRMEYNSTKNASEIEMFA